MSDDHQSDLGFPFKTTFGFKFQPSRPLSRGTVRQYSIMHRGETGKRETERAFLLPRLIDCDAAVRSRARHSEATRTLHFAFETFLGRVNATSHAFPSPDRRREGLGEGAHGTLR